jgi:DNA segregation ATPase FtsK/SpoIIIE, S-DNA-T family
MTTNNEAYTRNRSNTPATPLPNRLVILLTEARWILFAAFCVYLILILFTYNKLDPGWSQANVVPKIANIGGRVGAWIADLLLFIFGLSAWWFCVVLVRLVWSDYRQLNRKILVQPTEEKPHDYEKFIQIAGFVLLMTGSMGIEYLRKHSMSVPLPRAPGGVLGDLIGNAAFNAFGFTGSTLILLLLFALGISLYFHISWLLVAEKLGTVIETIFEFIQNKYADREDRKVGQTAAVKREELVVHERAKIIEAPPIRIEPQVIAVQKSERVEKERQVSLFNDMPDSNLPPLSLLDDAPVAQETVSIEILEFTSRLIEKKLSDFGVEAKVIAAYPGPVITRYEIEPAMGVKGSQIVGLARDLARSLSLTSIRVVETIPGKNYMGLELPNPKRQIVRLTEILGSKIYNDSASSLTIALGKDIAGHPVVADLAKMPHLL